MRRCRLVDAGLAVSVVLEPTIAQARAGTAKVACVQQQALESFVVTIRKPRTCIFARPCGKSVRLYTRARIIFNDRTTTAKLPGCSG